MNKCTIALMIAVVLFGCRQNNQDQHPPIIEKIPLSDRDLLLEPLESSIDDVVEAIKADGSYFRSGGDFDQGSMSFALSGPDTVMIELSFNPGEGYSEEHGWYYGKRSELIFSRHKITWQHGAEYCFPVVEEYKFYYEGYPENLLSSYARVTTVAGEEPAEWTPVCLTAERERLLVQRIDFFRGLMGADQPI
ncbi:MAG: hypothetical protein Kow0075_15840 [Salibacteraceae bacterium]